MDEFGKTFLIWVNLGHPSQSLVINFNILQSLNSPNWKCAILKEGKMAIPLNMKHPN